MRGVNVKVAQERLGHADISTTLNIYSHVLPSSAKEAAEKIGAMVYEGVAVSTYMVSEHDNRCDQKEFFLKGYREML